MRLAFDIPAGWRGRRRGDHVTIERAPFGARVLATPLAPSDVDLRSMLSADLPIGSKLQRIQALDRDHTRCGWPFDLIKADVVDHGDRTIEVRVAAAYEMLDYRGIAVGCATDFQADYSAILEILRSGRPYLWPEEIVCLAELWMMEDL